MIVYELFIGTFSLKSKDAVLKECNKRHVKIKT